jgi:hypothetical protein
MGPAILVFLIVAAIIIGGSVAVTRLPGALATRRLDQRLRDVSMPAWGSNEELEETVIKPSWRSGPGHRPDGVELVDAAADRAVRRQHDAERAAAHEHRRRRRARLTAYLITSRAICSGVGRHRRSGAADAVSVPPPDHAVQAVRGAVPEALDLLSRAIRAGHAFQTAMGMVADELPPPVGPEFRRPSTSRTSACRCATR